MEYAQAKKQKIICEHCGIEHYVVECAYCGKVFNATNPRNSFCSSKCKGDYHDKPKIELICERCGKIFEGTRYAHNCPECVKIIQSETGKENIWKTLEKYGVSSPSQMRKRVRNITNEERERHRESGKKALISYKEKTGYDNPGQNPEVKRKVVETNRDRFGVDYYMQTEEFKDRSKQTCNEKYGVDRPCQITKNKITQVNIKRGEWLKTITNEEVSYEFPLGGYCYDIKCGKFLFEIDPTWTHNSSKSFFEDKDPLPKLYHQKKTLAAEDAGYHCIHLFDRDDNDTVKEWIKGLITKRKRLYHGELRKVDPKEAEVFYSENHLQGKCSATVHYGLYVKDKLINCMSFTCFKGEWQLVRFASLKGYRIAHGAEKLFNAFVKEYDPDYIVSFSDITKHSGGLYNALGFKLEKINAPSYWRTDINGKHVYRRRDCQKQNMHRLEGFDPDYKYLEHKDDPFWQQTENQLMIGAKYLKVYDAGMRRHLWIKKDQS